MDCVFCKIIKGEELERSVIYENDTVIAIKPRTEISPGHTLVLPKEHYVDVFDIPESLLKEVAAVSQIVAKELKEKHTADGVNLLNASGKDAQQTVFHFHLHIVPRYKDDGLDLWFRNRL